MWGKASVHICYPVLHSFHGLFHIVHTFELFSPILCVFFNVSGVPFLQWLICMLFVFHTFCGSVHLSRQVPMQLLPPFFPLACPLSYFFPASALKLVFHILLVWIWCLPQSDLQPAILAGSLVSYQYNISTITCSDEGGKWFRGHCM